MSVYPLTFSIGSFEITGYGIMMMVGFLVGGWIIQQQLAERNLNEEYAWDIVVAAVIGGIIGAKLWYVFLTQDAGALLSRGGLVWYGGFLGGFAGVVINGMMKKVPYRFTAELVAPALAVGYALGRIGCFLVQDDYGRPTNLPWGFKFPEGLPPSTAFNLNFQFGIPIPDGVSPTEILAVHPTQLYEAIIMMTVFGILWRIRNHSHGMGWLFACYLLAAGFERFLVEILRAKDDRFLGIFTVAQLTSAGLVVAGMWLLMRYGKKDDFSLPKDSAVLRPTTP